MKELVVTKRDLSIKSIILTDLVIPVEDIMTPQKTTIEIALNESIEIDDLVVLRNDSKIEYIGKIQDLKHTTETGITTLWSYPAVSLFDFTGIMTPCSGNVATWLQSVLTANFVGTADERVNLPLTFVNGITTPVMLNYPFENGNIQDAIRQVFVMSGVYMKFDLTYTNGQPDSLRITFKNANENEVLKIKYNDPTIIKPAEFDFSLYQGTNKVIINPETGTGTVYVYYLYNDGTMGTNPDIKRITPVVQDITTYPEGASSLDIQRIAGEILFAETQQNMITFSVKKNASYPFELYKKCTYVDRNKTYSGNFVTKIIYAGEELVVTLGNIRTSLVDKLKFINEQVKAVKSALKNIKGVTGEKGVGIDSIVKTSTVGKVDTYTIYYTDGSTDTFTVTNGNDGVGIASIVKTSTVGLVDTYTITFTDSTTTTFTVTNGAKGDTGEQGEQGVSLRGRGVWATSTDYVNNSSYIDFVYYDGKSYWCKVSHTSSTTPDLDPTNWGVLVDTPQEIINNTYLPIGSVFPSAIGLTDSWFHKLDGSVISQSGVYSQFSAWLHARVAENPSNVPTTTETNWQSENTTYGQCGKFVIDDTAGTIRLPRITEFIASNNGGQDIGTAQNDQNKYHNDHSLTINQSTGLTGQLEFGDDNNANMRSRVRYTDGICSAISTYTCSKVNSSGVPTADNSANAVTINANHSHTGAVGGSGTVGDRSRPRNIRYPYYIVVANATKTDIEIDIDAVASDLNLQAGQIANLEQFTPVGIICIDRSSRTTLSMPGGYVGVQIPFNRVSGAKGIGSMVGSTITFPAGIKYVEIQINLNFVPSSNAGELSIKGRVFEGSVGGTERHSVGAWHIGAFAGEYRMLTATAFIELHQNFISSGGAIDVIVTTGSSTTLTVMENSSTTLNVKFYK